MERVQRNAPGGDAGAVLGAGGAEDGMLREGTRFGKYVVGRRLAEGGMARIFRAEHAELQRPVALKVLSPHFAREPEGRERFLREARIAAAIKHPNVVNIFDVGVLGQTPYMAMELLDGEDLELTLRRRRVLDETTIMDAIIPVTAGLAVVHDAGIVHRDLKPANVFLARGHHGDIEPKLLDFGISRSVHSEAFRLTAGNGLLMGTPEYLSPEYIRGGDVTPLSDQYSLGVILYECATGVNPFSADSLAETMRNVTRGEVASPATHNPRLSPRLVSIIQRAMSPTPSDRFEDMRALGRQLLFLAGKRTRITWGLSFGSSPGMSDGGAPSSALVAPSRPRRGKALLLAGAIAAGLAGVAWGVTGLTDGLVPSEATPSEATRTETAQLAPEQLLQRRLALEPASAGSAEPPVPAPVSAVAPADASEAMPGEPAVASDESPQPEPSGAPPAHRPEPARTPPRRSVVPRRLVRAAPAPPARAGGQPDWVIPASERDSQQKPGWAEDVGTNSAPILD